MFEINHLYDIFLYAGTIIGIYITFSIFLPKIMDEIREMVSDHKKMKKERV